MAPSIIVGNALLKGSVVANDEWRTYGETRRRELLKKDEQEGGRTFTIDRSISLKKYVSIGDRVSSLGRGHNVLQVTFTYCNLS